MKTKTVFFYKETPTKNLPSRMKKVEYNLVKDTVIPYSELALHLGIAGKKGKFSKVAENWVIVEVDGKKYEGLVSELVDILDR